jgi:hypothetical protein
VWKNHGFKDLRQRIWSLRHQWESRCTIDMFRATDFFDHPFEKAHCILVRQDPNSPELISDVKVSNKE